MRRALLVATLAACLTGGCDASFDNGFSLSKRQEFRERSLRIGERFPDMAEAAAIGPLAVRIERRSPEFSRLVRCDDARIVVKDEEGTGADRLMTGRLRDRLERLAALVSKEWPDLRLRVTEAWDERREHGPNSVHYEGRAADVTTSDVDPEKLGRLARLAIDAGFDWVFYEDASHVHVSVKR
jgi:hypothetical protein